jgi:hypothetical protein
MLRTRPARFVKIILNREIMLDFGLKFCYTIIVERESGGNKLNAPRPERHNLRHALSTSQRINLTNSKKSAIMITSERETRG